MIEVLLEKWVKVTARKIAQLHKFTRDKYGAKGEN